VTEDGAEHGKPADTPVVLLEAGVIVNRNEELALQDPA